MPKPNEHPDETSLLKDLKDIKRRIQALEGQTRLESATIERGSLTIRGGGLEVLDSNGDLIGWVGYWGGAPAPDGTPQSGFVFNRNDSGPQTTPAIALLDYVPGDEDGFRQVISVFDRRGHRILEDDPGGFGMNNPQFPLPVTPGGDGHNGDGGVEIEYAMANTYYGWAGPARGAPSHDKWYPAYTARGICQHPYLVVSFDLFENGTVASGSQWKVTINESEFGTEQHSVSGTFFDDTSVNLRIDLVGEAQLSYERSYSVKIQVKQSPGTVPSQTNNISVRVNTIAEVGSDFELS